MKKLKILFISHTARTAGAEGCLLTLVRHLDKEKFESVVVLPVDGALGEELRLAGARTIVSSVEWWARGPRTYGLVGSDVSGRVRSLMRIIAAERPAVVHSNTSVIWEGALAAAFAGVPHVWHLHEKLAAHPSIKTLLPLPVVYSLMDILSERVVAVSEAVRTQVSGPITAAKVSAIFNGIQAPVSSFGLEKELRAELGIAGDVAIAVSIGALIPEKGYDTLIDAAVLAQQRGKVAFVIVGRGERDAVRELMSQVYLKGLSGCIYHLGYRSDISRILAGADLLVLPSHSEAFSLVVLEAMAAGKPVVATDCGGPSEMVLQGETGFIVPVGDHVALAKGIWGVLADRALGKRMGVKGRERFVQLFTAQSYADRFAELYREIAGAGPKSPLEDSERIFLEGIMATYQRIAENALLLGARQELVRLSKRVAAIPLRPVQWAIDWKKRHRR